MSASQKDIVKVILIGESGVGKTNLIKIIKGEEFEEIEPSTEAGSSSTKEILVRGNKYTIQIWDTIGQEKLRNLTKMFYNNSKIVIFVYDITERKSFEEINNYWVKDIEEKIGNDIIKGLIANKIDLFLNEKVTEDEGEEYAKSIGAQFLLTSAKAYGPGKFEEFLIHLYEEYLDKNKANSPGRKNSKKNKNIVLKKDKNVGNNNNGSGGRRKKCC